MRPDLKDGLGRSLCSELCWSQDLLTLTMALHGQRLLQM